MAGLASQIRPSQISRRAIVSPCRQRRMRNCSAKLRKSAPDHWYRRAELSGEAEMSRSTWIQVFLFLHILGAITAVGPTLSYALWVRLGERGSAAERSFALRGISWVDSHLATPAFM